MIEEFKKIKSNEETRFVLEFSDAGVTGSTSIASVEKPIGELQSRTEPPKPRNFVAKNAKMGGAGQHKDKKKAAKQGDVKHKNKEMAEGVAETVPMRTAQKVLNHYGADYFGTTYDTLYFYKNRKEFSIGRIRDDDPASAGSVSLSELNAMVRKLRGMRSSSMPYKEGVAEDFNGEYDDEAGMAQSNLLTTARAVQGLLDTIKDRDNLPEWAQEKIAKAEMMLVSVWDYLQSQKEMGVDPQQDIEEAFQNDEANLMYRYDDVSGRLKQDMVSNYDEKAALRNGWAWTQKEALSKVGIIPSKFKPGKWIQKQGAQWVEVFPYGNQSVEEGDAYMESLASKLAEKIPEDAKVDRQAKHITKSMMKAHPGMSKDDAESAAWAHIKHPKKNKK